MHFDIPLTDHSRRTLMLESGHLALGRWVFVPLPGEEELVTSWLRHEHLLPQSGEGTKAEFLVRRTRPADFAPQGKEVVMVPPALYRIEILVRGRVRHPGQAPLDLGIWHRAVRA